jgi:mono/diheme cytochrome c family protein
MFSVLFTTSTHCSACRARVNRFIGVASRARCDGDLAACLANGPANGHGAASGPMAEAVDRSFSQMTADDIKSVAAYVRSVVAIASPDLPATPAPPAPVSHRDGGGGKDTPTSAAAINDPSGANVLQVVLSGTTRLTPDGALSMPAFGNGYSDDEIAATLPRVSGPKARASPQTYRNCASKPRNR